MTEIRELCTPDDTVAAAELFSGIWQDPTLLHPHFMLVLAATGNYVAGAYDGSTLVGASVAFFTGELPRSLHSHITGVVAGVQGTGVGRALKLHQRRWALRRGVETIEWTVDPLVRRNIYFNLAKLGATVSAYRPEFYGPMTDAVNSDDASDRLLLTWSLSTPQVVAAASGTPIVGTPDPATRALLSVGPAGEPVVGALGELSLSCALPGDIVHMRQTDPELARSWRYALRDTLGAAIQHGYRVAGVSRDGAYLLALG